jgi:hypothetical protein
MRIGRSRFRDVVTRQLDIFAVDLSTVVEEEAAAWTTWNNAGRDEAEDAYADWQLVADAMVDELTTLRDGYAATLDSETAPKYEDVFTRVARRRFPRLGELLE